MSSQPEARLQTRIVRELRRAGYPAWRIRPAGLRGWPDLYILKPGGRACHVEVKMPGKKPSKLQFQRLAELKAGGAVTGWATSFEGVMEIVRNRATRR